jgi:Zn-dependent protease
MFLEDPGRSAYDLNFRLFDTPVQIHPSFWLLSVVFGWNALPQDGFILYLVLWVACCFVSILIHEFGHVLMGRVFGQPGRIVLYGMGGLAIGSNGRTRWQQIAVSFAGPGAGFLFLGVILLALTPYAGMNVLYVTYHLLRWESLDLGLENFPPWVDTVVWDLVFLNLVWGLFNLLPLWPLDGGMICRELCQLANPGAGLRLSLLISFITATVIALNAISPELRKSPTDLHPAAYIPYLPTGRYIAIFTGLLAVGSYMLLQQTQRPNRGPSRDDDDYRDRVPWERDADWWKRG